MFYIDIDRIPSVYAFPVFNQLYFISFNVDTCLRTSHKVPIYPHRLAKFGARRSLILIAQGRECLSKSVIINSVFDLNLYQRPSPSLGRLRRGETDRHIMVANSCHFVRSYRTSY